MDRDVTPELRADAADLAQAEGGGQDNAMADTGSGAMIALRQHPALCQLGLPLSAATEAWRRDIGALALSIEAPAGAALPHGAALRLLLLQVFSAALATGERAVEMGADAAALARRMGWDGDVAALGEQYRHLAGCRLVLEPNGGPTQSVFDARGRPRTGDEWRPTLRLAAKFMAGLAQDAITLDRAVVAALAGEPLALDAYMWLACGLARPPADGLAGAGWDDLYGRFGDRGQTPESFRAAFEECLRRVTVACPAMVVIIGEDDVRVRPPAPAAAVPAATPGEGAARPPAPKRAEAAAPPPAEVAPREPEPRAGQALGLKSHMTGLAQVIWLQPANGRENQVIEVTPGGRYDPDHVTVLALEPLVVQVSGGLHDREFERVAAWAMTNRDLIDDVWDGKIASLDEAAQRVRKVPAPGWR